MHAPGTEEQILPTASGPAKEILLCKYIISGETNNLHAEKADGTKAFVTATELVAAGLLARRKDFTEMLYSERKLTHQFDS